MHMLPPSSKSKYGRGRIQTRTFPQRIVGVFAIVVGGGVVVPPLLFVGVNAEPAKSTSSFHWYYDELAPIQDHCDYTKWKVCDQQSDCDTYEKWTTLTFGGVGTHVPTWESEQSYSNYKKYKCISPDEEIKKSEGEGGVGGISSWPLPASTSTSTSSTSSSCPAKRCMPDTVQSAYMCTEDADCFDGEVCDTTTNTNSQASFCTACRSRAATTATSAPDTTEDAVIRNALYYSNDACSQPQTPGLYGSPSFQEHESGCAGDHCHNVCAYDTKCVRITSTTTELDVTATHNQLPGKLTLTDEDRQHLMRPSQCGGTDAGVAGPMGQIGTVGVGGMRCARSIHKEITSKERTPTGSKSRSSSSSNTAVDGEKLRDRTQDIIELSFNTNSYNGDDSDRITISDADYKNDRVLDIKAKDNYESDNNGAIGYNVNSGKYGTIIVPTRPVDNENNNDVDEDVRHTIGTGILASARGMSPWDNKRGLVRCDVKYVTNIPVRTTSDTTTSDTSSSDTSSVPVPVSTLLTRICVRKEKITIDENDDANDDEWTWSNNKDPSDSTNTPTLIKFDTSSEYCFPWGTTSSTTQRYYFTAKCSVTGPNVFGYDRIPSMKQRNEMKARLLLAFQKGTIKIWDLVRLSFHDAAAYTSPLSELDDAKVDESESETIDDNICGGPRGCIRYEHVHGNAANVGLAFVIGPQLWEAIGCQPGSSDYNANVHYYQNGYEYDHSKPPLDLIHDQKCISMADAIQYVGAVAIEAANGPKFSHKVAWGRVDAPRMFCTGELQTQMPDAQGGHREGTFQYGSSQIHQRLETVYNSTKHYFETQLGLTNEEWVAYLGGGHSVGGIKGLIQSRNTRFNFDATPTIFDMLYFDRIEKASQTKLLSLCPQFKKPGADHFFEPKHDLLSKGSEDFVALLDTDVSLTSNDKTMDIISTFRANRTLFFDLFEQAYLHVSELGYETEQLIQLGHGSNSDNDEHDNTGSPTDSPTGVPTKAPTDGPTNVPTTSSPTDLPTKVPTSEPTESITEEELDTHTFYRDIGYCLSEKDRQIEDDDISTPEKCLQLCREKFEEKWDNQVFVEYIKNGECYCQSTCPCLDDVETSGRTTMIPMNNNYGGGDYVPPRCDTDAPTTSPTKRPTAPPVNALCADKTGTVKLVGKGNKSCAIIRKRGFCQFKVKNEGGKKAKVFCPTACGVGECGDSPVNRCADKIGRVTLVNKGMKTCRQIGKKKWCDVRVKITGRPKAKTLCPTTCSVDGC